MIWYTNDSGYTCALKLSEIQQCRSCGKTFKRKLVVFAHSDKEFEDACPNCKHVYNTFLNLKFDNVLCE